MSVKTLEGYTRGWSSASQGSGNPRTSPRQLLAYLLGKKQLWARTSEAWTQGFTYYKIIREILILSTDSPPDQGESEEGERQVQRGNQRPLP